MQQISVFIYGTLLPGQSNHHVVSSYIKGTSEGQIFGRMVDCGHYPAAVRDEIAKQNYCLIRGQWIIVNREGLISMDRLEEFFGVEEQNDYERIWVSDKLDNRISGWVYVWSSSRGCPAIKENYWPTYYTQKMNK